jgi:hypothetical protein
MTSIFDANVSFVYADSDIETKTLNIGLKTPNGEDKLTYITSCESPEYWKRRRMGKLERTYLFIGSEAKARAAEWFALDFGFSIDRKFFNAKNNAHKTDESILSVSEKQVIIDFLREQGNGIEFGSSDSMKAATNNRIITSIADAVKNINRETNPDKRFQVVMVPISEVLEYDRSQVRVELDNNDAVTKIRQRMLEDPTQALDKFGPISVVVLKNGNKLLVNGNTRLKAASRTPGWDEVPVVFINESEFGSTKKIRERNFVKYGLYMNKEDFEVRTTNTKEDLKRNINNFLAEEKLDLSKQTHVDRARDLVYANFSFACGSKQQLNGILASIQSDFEKDRAALQYQKNLRTYDESFFKNYCWDNYQSKDRSTVHATVGEAANAKPLAYICRVMTREKNKKGAIVLHYTSKHELAAEAKKNWVEDLKETIKYMKLDIIVDVLPPFDE